MKLLNPPLAPRSPAVQEVYVDVTMKLGLYDKRGEAIR